MGLALILVGLGIFISQVMGKDIVKLSIKLWPLLLIFLGLEVIYANHRNNKEGEDQAVKIDILSILIIGFLLVSNLGLWAIHEIGFLDYVKDTIYFDRTSMIVSDSLEVDPKLRKLVVEASGNMGLEVNYGDFTGLNYSGNLTINNNRSSNSEEFTPSWEIIDNVGYLRFKGYSDDGHYDSMDLNIPRDLNVEFKNGRKLSLILDGIEGNIDVRNFNEFDLTIKGDEDLLVSAVNSNREAYSGNMDWNIIEEVGSTDTNYLGRIELLNGRHKIKIRDVEGLLEVNKF